MAIGHDFTQEEQMISVRLRRKQLSPTKQLRQNEALPGRIEVSAFLVR